VVYPAVIIKVTIISEQVIVDPKLTPKDIDQNIIRTIFRKYKLSQNENSKLQLSAKRIDHK